MNAKVITTIPINQIVINPNQPRENFDKDKLNELAESILSIGLINPIIVREKGSKFELVAGERRFKAHQIAKIKEVPAIVKKYNSEGQVAVESLIENVHREDLSPQEKGKFCKQIMEIEKIKSVNELTKRIGSNLRAVQSWVDDYEYRATTRSNADHTLIRATKGLEQKERERIVKFAEKKGIASRKIEEEFIPTIKKAQTEVKDALLGDEITIDQAERIIKLKTEKERGIAIKQHEDISKVEKSVERVVKQQVSASEKRKLEKQLTQANNWIASFKGKVVDTRKEIESTIKILLISTKFIPTMDDKQKEKLDDTLDRFIEILEKGTQLSEQIKERL